MKVKLCRRLNNRVVVISIINVIIFISVITMSKLVHAMKREQLVPIILTPDSEVYRHRASAASKVCFKSLHDKTFKVFSDKRDTLAFCSIPKVACTFWLNILRFVNNETGGQAYETPFDIPRYLTHNSHYEKLSIVSPNNQSLQALSNKFRFMFVRDPYSRLWSAWIDKFLLPGLWLNDGLKIAKFFNFSKEILYDIFITEENAECPKNISFIQFLSFITNDEFIKNPGSLDSHWKPQMYQCDPCLFRPHVIGKLETFSIDTRAILDAVNLTWVLNLPNRKQTDVPVGLDGDRSIQEMRMLTVYNFRWADYLKQYTKSQDCFKTTEIYNRLWTAFQYNGHLPRHVPFPYHTGHSLSLTEETFLKLCEETHTLWNKELSSSDFKRATMVEAYSKVPENILKRLQKLYALDFEMFEYNIQPPTFNNSL